MNPKPPSKVVKSLEQLNNFVDTRKTLYEMLNKLYVLPALPYLLKYAEDPIPIYVCEIEGAKIC